MYYCQLVKVIIAREIDCNPDLLIVSQTMSFIKVLSDGELLTEFDEMFWLITVEKVEVSWFDDFDFRWRFE